MTYIEYLEDQAEIWIENQIKLGGFNAKRNIKETNKSNVGSTSNANNLVLNKHSID